MGFEVIAEIEPPTGGDTARLHTHVGALHPVSTRYLVPDSHLGRPTVSSLVVAGLITTPERPAIACLNARDRNLLGVRRDLLTAAHLGVSELLLVRGDAPTVGEPAGGVSVRDLVAECEAAGLAYGVTAGAGPLPAWKRGAARVFCQVGWTLDELLRRHDVCATDRPMFAGVLALPNLAMARRLGASVPELRPPAALLDALERDSEAGVRAAADLVAAIEASGTFAGVHLVVGARPRAVAAALLERTGTPFAGATSRRNA